MNFSRQPAFLKRFAARPYLLAVMAVAIAAGLRMALDPVLGTDTPYLTFFGAVLAARHLGGRGPALAAVGMSCTVICYLFLEPRFSFAVADPKAFVSLGLFVAICVLISLLETSSDHSSFQRFAAHRLQSAGSPLQHRIIMLSAAVLAIGILVSLLWAGYQRSRDEEGWVARTYQVLGAAGSLGLYLERAQSSERGYLLTGEDQYREAYQSWVASAHEAAATLRRLTADSRIQQQRLDEFDPLLQARLEALSSAMEIRRREGAAAAAVFIRAHRGGAVMDQLRSVLDAVNNEEHRLLESRNRALRDDDARTRWILGLGAGSLVVLLVLAGASVERRTRERDIAQEAIARQARLIDLSHDAIITTDGSRVITGWNTGAEVMYGWASRQAVGRTLHELLHTEVEVAIPEIDRVLEHNERWTGELTQTRADGQRIVVESCQVLYRTGSGRVTGYLEINRDITARRQNEEALRLSGEKFAKAFNTNPAAMAIARLEDGLLLDVNQAWQAMMGYTRVEALGRTSTDLRIWPSIETRAAYAAELDEKGTIQGLEVAQQRKSGEPFVALLSGCTLTIGGEKMNLSALLDITDRKRVEEALRQSESQFRTLANAIHQLCWMADPDGWIVWYNDRWYEYTGTTPEQMEGWGWQTVHDARILPSVLERWKHSISTAEPFDMVFPLRGSDGVFRPFLTRVVPVRDAEGKVVRWFGTNTDIGAQKQAEAEVRRTRNLLELFIKSAPVALAMFDRNMRYIRASDRWLRDTGAGEQPVIGQPHYELFPDLPEHWKEAHRRGLAGEPSKGEEDWVALDGRTHTIRWEVHPWGDSATETGGVILGFEDITAAKRAEEALRESEQRVRRLNAELEQRVRDRTAQLEASNKELEAFAYSVSHDLRAPLRGIDGFSLALVEDYGAQLDEKAHSYLNRVRSETQRMGSLIDDLLQLSRITRAEMRHAPVDLTTIAHAVAARLREAHPGRHIDFQIEPDLTAVGDAPLLEIALTNLLGNAVKFTGRRSQARIAVGQAQQDGTSCFFIRDNGAGFDMAYADNLFGAFQRLHKPSEFPGSGIGLATVHRVVRRHGGRIWAEAQPDQGATFYLTLEQTR